MNIAAISVSGAQLPPMAKRPSLGRVVRPRADRNQLPVGAEPPIAEKLLRGLHRFAADEELERLAARRDAEAVGRIEVALSDGARVPITVPLGPDQQGPSQTVFGIAAPDASDHEPEPASSQVPMQIEPMGKAAALDSLGERLQRGGRIVPDHFGDSRVVDEERGEAGLGHERDRGVRVAFPEGPNQRRGQQHVAHGAQSDDQDAGGHEGWEDNVLLALLHA